MQEYHHRSKRSMVPTVCYGIAAVLLVAVIVLGAVGVGLPLWATLKPIKGETGVSREVRVGLFDIMLTSTYDTCLPILPRCRLPQGAFSLETGNVTENLLDVNVRQCWTHCTDNNQMEIFSILRTTEYLTVLQQRIFNITLGEVVTDRTIPVTCRNFVAPRGMIIAGLATACAALVLALLGTKFVVMGGLSGCLCMCAFVVQLVGLILAACYAVRPCDRMNESWSFHLGASFIVTLISTALLLVATIFTTCGVFAYSVDKGMKMAHRAAHSASEELHHHGHADGHPRYSTSSAAYPGHGQMPMSNTNSHLLGSEFANIHTHPAGSETRRSSEFRDSQMQPPYVSSGGVGGIHIPIISTPMSGPYGGGHLAAHGFHGPAIVTHTTHTEERTYTQAAPEV